MAAHFMALFVVESASSFPTSNSSSDKFSASSRTGSATNITSASEPYPSSAPPSLPMPITLIRAGAF